MGKQTATRPLIEPGVVRGQWWHPLADGRIRCDACPRYCKLREGQRGFCYVREVRGGQLVLASYGRASGYCVDPIEKKPLNHFYPGSGVLSFGTVGCNLGCRYCQNWDISQAKDLARLADPAMPDRVVVAAAETGCKGIAFTYNDPIIFAEYAIDCAREARRAGLKTVAVSSGYVTPEARRDFYAEMDAVNVDLKSFSESFYSKTCLAHREPVLDTLRWLARETEVWLEITTLLIPGHNDSPGEVAELCDWVASELGPRVPLHFTAFHPDFRMRDVPPTPRATLVRARGQARAAGLAHVYTGNVYDPEGQSTRCETCSRVLVGRDRYRVTAWGLDASGRCASCGTALVGHFDAAPSGWGARRLPISIC